MHKKHLKDVSFLERNREIGTAILHARIKKGMSISDCAVLLKTSRRRYGEMERGNIGITIPELEILMTAFGVSPDTILEKSDAQSISQRLVVQAQPGERIERIELHVQMRSDSDL